MQSMATINYASLVLKDKDGNIGTVRTLSQTDIAKINNAVTVTTRSGLPVYSSAIDYEVGFVVRSGTYIYQALAANGPDEPAGVQPVNNGTYWAQIGSVAASAKVIWTGYNNYADDASSNQVKLQHDHTFRGSNLLGNGHFASLDALSRALAAGNFSDIYIGDYIDAAFSYGGASYTARCRVAGIDYYMSYGDGTDIITRHHLAMVPDSTIMARMNSTDTTNGGYVGSEMYTTTLPALMNALGGASGTPFYGHLLSFRELLSNAIVKTAGIYSAMHPGTLGFASNWAWYTVSGVLMSEQQIYGSTLSASSVWAQGNCKQLPLFNLVPEYAFCTPTKGRQTHWLRSVAQFAAFCLVVGNGHAASTDASYRHGVRPLFVIV